MRAPNFIAFLLLILLTRFTPANDGVQTKGDQVAILYNSAMPESLEVARYYAEKRNIPANRLFGFKLPEGEVISREEFQQSLQQPLWNQFLERKLFTFAQPGAGLPSQAAVRYLVVCYGVPVKIAATDKLKEDAPEGLQQELRRNEAAVDSELACLPQLSSAPKLTGFIPNPAAQATNTLQLQPTTGLLMVARLDGPSSDIAKGLVDKALQAEKDGLWGRSYIDTRGLVEGPYEVGDRWLNLAAQMTRTFGYETTVDNNPPSFPAATPLSHVALYFGWYDFHVSGPFLAPKPEFVPGAIAYHLNSFSANVLRSRDQRWVGPLLTRGVTATVGYTEEPYLQFTLDIPIFLQRLLFRGMTFGEAAYAALPVLSWQTTVVGDPLYEPFRALTPEGFARLLQEPGPLGDWALLFQINRNLAAQPSALDQLLAQMEKIGRVPQSALLQEKLGDLYKSRARLVEAVDAYQSALKLDPSPGQRLRLILVAAPMLKNLGKAQQSYDLYQVLLRDYPDYPDKKPIYEKLAELATRLGKPEQAEEFRKLSSANR